MNEGALDKIIPSELTTRNEKNFTFGERLSIGITKSVLSLADASEVAKTYAEKIGVNVEYADYWLTYILSELKTGLAGEKGGWGITYAFNCIDTIKPEVIREHFIADMLWEMYKDVGKSKQLAALKMTTGFDEHGQLDKLDFHPDIRNWPLTIRVFKQPDHGEPTTFVDVIIQKDACEQTIKDRDFLAGFEGSVLENPFALVEWQKIIDGENVLPEGVKGILISEERILTDWYTEPSKNDDDAVKLESDFYSKPDIVMGLKTETFNPGNAFYDPRPTLVLSIDEETNAVSFKLPTHVSFDGKDVTNAWKDISNKKIYKHFYKRVKPKNDLRFTMKQNGLFESQVLPVNSWLANRNQDQGIDGGNTHLIEKTLKSEPFEHEGTKQFAELMGVRRIQASRDLPDFLLDLIKKFRKQPELLEKYGDIKTSTLIMIALYLVDGRLPGTPIDPDDGRLGITSMGNKILEPLLASREILTSNSENLERHLVKVQMADIWLNMITNDHSSKEAFTTLRNYLNSISRYNFANFDNEIEEVLQTQRADQLKLSIIDRKALSFLDKVMPFLEKSKNKNELLFQLINWILPTEDNTAPLPDIDEFLLNLSMNQDEAESFAGDLREIMSLTRGIAYSKDDSNELLFRLKPICTFHSELAKSQKQNAIFLESVDDLRRLLEEFTSEEEFVKKLEKDFGNLNSTEQYMFLSNSDGLFTDIESDQITLSTDLLVEEVLKLVDEDKKRPIFEKFRKALKGVFKDKSSKLNPMEFPTSGASMDLILRKLKNGSKKIPFGTATHLEKIYREIVPATEGIQSVVGHIDMIFGALYEIADMEFESEEERIEALNATYDSLKILTDDNSVFPVWFVYSKNDWPSDKLALKRYLGEKRRSAFKDVIRAHKRAGLLYKLKNWEQNVIDLDSVQVHHFTNDVIDAGVKTSKVIDMMSRDVSRAASSISARLSSAQFLESTANVLAPEIMADLRPLSNVSSLGAVESQRDLDVDVIFPTANAGHNTNVGWGLYGDVLTYSCSADDPKELVEVVLPFVRANDELVNALSQFVFTSRSSDLTKKFLEMIRDRSYLCATEEVNSEEEKDEKRKLREQGYILGSRQRKENFQASANMTNRLAMMENDNYFLQIFTDFCHEVLSGELKVSPEVYGLIDNYVRSGFKQTWEAHAQYRLAHFSTEMLNVLFILQSGLTPNKSMEKLREFMQINQKDFRAAIEELTLLYKQQSDEKSFLPEKKTPEAVIVVEDKIKDAALRMLEETKKLI